MSTSGTIDTTVIATDTVLAHAMRRCGIAATGQTPEIVEIAQECLFLLLLSLSSRGLNLWAVDKRILDIVVGKKVYVLPAGTLDVLNMAYSQATYVTGTDTVAATSYQTVLGTATTVVRVGVTFTVTPASSSVLFQFSDDGITWTTATSVPILDISFTGERDWFDMNISGSHTYYRIYASGAAFTATEFLLCSTVNDLPVKAMNRDDYTSLPNKDNPSSVSVNYFFEKLLDPTVTLWPVPNVTGNQLSVWRHRQVQDVGSLTQELELPNRWFEAIIWQLALRLVFELPAGTVPPERVQMVAGMTKEMLIEVESGETDHAPQYYAPNIRPYSA